MKMRLPFRITCIGCRHDDIEAITRVVEEAGRTSLIDLVAVDRITASAFPKPIVHAVVFSPSMLGTVDQAQEKFVHTATAWGTFRVYLIGEPQPKGSRWDDFVQRTPAQDATDLAHTILAFFDQADAVNRLGLVRGLRDVVCKSLYRMLGLLWPISYLCLGTLLLGAGLNAAGYPVLWKTLSNPKIAALLSCGVTFFLVHYLSTVLRNLALVLYLVRRVPPPSFFLPLFVLGTLAGAALWASHGLGHGEQIVVWFAPALGLRALYLYSRRIRAELFSLSQIQDMLEANGSQANELLDIGRTPISSDAIPLRPHRARGVFISYMHRSDWSVRTASECHAHLTAARYPVFFDRSTIEAGSRWRTQLMRGLSECGVFIAVLDSEADVTSWVLSESVYAATLRKNIGKPRILLVIRDPVRLARGPFGRIYHDLFTLPESHHPGIQFLAVPPEGISKEYLLASIDRIQPLCILGRTNKPCNKQVPSVSSSNRANAGRSKTINYDSRYWRFFFVLVLGVLGAAIGHLLDVVFQTPLLSYKIGAVMAVSTILYFRIRSSYRSGICFVCRRFVQTEIERRNACHEDPLFAGGWERQGKICQNCGRVACYSCSDVPCQCGHERRMDIGVTVSM